MCALSCRRGMCGAALLVSFFMTGLGCNLSTELKENVGWSKVTTGFAYDTKESELVGNALTSITWSVEDNIHVQVGFGGAFTGEGTEAAGALGVLLQFGEDREEGFGVGVMHWANANGDPVTGPYFVLQFKPGR